jgi:hypothetical protein
MTIKTIHLTQKAKFHPGKVVATAGFMDKVDPEYAFAALGRHLIGDWGLCDREDWKSNEEALQHDLRLLSVYPLPDEAGNFWIITEADRSVTTMLLPKEY